MGDLVESDSLEVIAEAFAPLLASAGSGYLEAPACAIGIAAAEAVAALGGQASPDLPDEVKEWAAERIGSARPDLVSNARLVIAAVTMNSELKNLWEDSDEYSAWQDHMAALSRRLA